MLYLVSTQIAKMNLFNYKYLSKDQIKGFDNYKVKIFNFLIQGTHCLNSTLFFYFFFVLVQFHRFQSYCRLHFASFLEPSCQGKLPIFAVYDNGRIKFYGNQLVLPILALSQMASSECFDFRRNAFSFVRFYFSFVLRLLFIRIQRNCARLCTNSKLGLVIFIVVDVFGACYG